MLSVPSLDQVEQAQCHADEPLARVLIWMRSHDNLHSVDD